MNAANCKIKTVHITNPDKLYDSLNVNHLKEPAIYNRLSFNLLIFFADISKFGIRKHKSAFAM